MNSVNLVGRLTADPETEQYEKEGKPTMVTRFRLAVDRGAAEGADFVPVTTFNVLAATCADVIGKGHLVAVSGRLHHSEWTTAEGERRSRLEVIASSVDFLARPRAGGEPATT
jgi:single-strand DNA-binding protein